MAFCQTVSGPQERSSSGAKMQPASLLAFCDFLLLRCLFVQRSLHLAVAPLANLSPIQPCPSTLNDASGQAKEAASSPLEAPTKTSAFEIATEMQVCHGCATFLKDECRSSHDVADDSFRLV